MRSSPNFLALFCSQNSWDLWNFMDVKITFIPLTNICNFLRYWSIVRHSFHEDPWALHFQGAHPDCVRKWRESADGSVGQRPGCTSRLKGLKLSNSIHKMTSPQNSPSGKLTVCDIENGHLVRGFTHKKWRFSIVMLVYRRVESVFVAGMEYEIDWNSGKSWQITVFLIFTKEFSMGIYNWVSKKSTCKGRWCIIIHPLAMV